MIPHVIRYRSQDVCKDILRDIISNRYLDSIHNFSFKIKDHTVDEICTRCNRFLYPFGYKLTYGYRMYDQVNTLCTSWKFKKLSSVLFDDIHVTAHRKKIENTPLYINEILTLEMKKQHPLYISKDSTVIKLQYNVYETVYVDGTRDQYKIKTKDYESMDCTISGAIMLQKNNINPLIHLAMSVGTDFDILQVGCDG